MNIYEVIDKGNVKVFNHHGQSIAYNSLTMYKGQLIGVLESSYHTIDSSEIAAVKLQKVERLDSPNKIIISCLNGKEYTGYLINAGTDSLFISQQKPRSIRRLPTTYGLAINEIKLIKWKNKANVGAGMVVGALSTISIMALSGAFDQPDPSSVGAIAFDSDVAVGATVGLVVAGSLVGAAVGSSITKTAIINGDQLNYILIKHKLYYCQYLE